MMDMKLLKELPLVVGSVLVLLPLPLCLSSLAAEEEVAAPAGPSADEILEMARRSYANRDYELNGNLRKGFSKTPFRLSMRERLIRFSFTDPEQALQLEFHDDRYLLWELLESGNALVDENRYALPVRKTDISYEDLAMRYLFWPEAVLDGVEKIKQAMCWKVAVKNPDSFGPYRHVILWIDQGSGVLFQIEGYDEENRLVRKMMVTKVRQIDGTWMLKEMRVEHHNAESGKVERTYLEVGDPGKKLPGLFNKG